jgi:hypothetical protein
MDWRDLDLALHEMYLFGELTVPNGGLYAKSQPSSVAAERLIVMMSKMVESGKRRMSDLTENYANACKVLLPLPTLQSNCSIWRFAFDTALSSRIRQITSLKF